MELTKWEEWSKEKMLVHLFLESADTEMSKLATTMLSKDTVNLSELRIQIRAIENSVWYKPNINHAKLVQPRNWGSGRVGEGASGAAGLCRICQSDKARGRILRQSSSEKTGKSISFSKKLMYLLLKGPSGQTATRVRRAWMCLKFTDIGWASGGQAIFGKNEAWGGSYIQTPNVPLESSHGEYP